MEKESMLKTCLFAVLMLLFPMGYSFPAQIQPVNPRPLCASQFALVNRACALLPYSRGPGPSDSAPGQRTPEPPGPPPPSTPPSMSDNPEDDYRREGHEKHGHGHRRHRHQPRSHHIKTTVETECCRWLAQVDDECVCDMLVHLPRFLRRPVHEYTVIVAESCSITFDCASALIP